MKGLTYFFVTFIALVFCVSTAFAQKPKKKQNVEKITSAIKQRTDRKATGTILDKAKLLKATKIVYSYSNGTVAPEYHYSVTITVTPTSVTVLRTKGYDGKKDYEKNWKITSGQYDEFINNLASQRMRKLKTDREGALCGGSSESIVVFAGAASVFASPRGQLQIAKDKLDTNFILLVPEKYRDKIHD